MFTLGNYALSILLLQLLISFNEFNGISCEHMSEGQTCTNDGKSGVCLSLEKCPLLEKNIKSKKLLPINYYCGFKENNVAIYCCTDIPVDLEVKASNFSQPLPKPGSNVIIYPMAEEQFKNKDDDAEILKQSANKNTKMRPAEIACDKIKKKYFAKRLDQKIVEGKLADVGEFPHMVALGYRKDGNNEIGYDCAGSLISEQYVLTAGHCVKTASKLPVVARMGRNNIRQKEINDGDGADIDIANITLHSSYRQMLSYNDIALIRLMEPITDTFFLHPACLYTKIDDLNENLNLTITGWGTTNVQTRTTSDSLLKAIVKPVLLNKCSESLKSFVEIDRALSKGVVDTQLCANDEKSDTCQGDSGGPIQISDDTSVSTIVGITSVGYGCGINIPGLYTRVASYLDWIESIVWPDIKN